MFQARSLTVAVILCSGSAVQAANFAAPAPVIPAVTPTTAGTVTHKDWRVEDRASSEMPAGVCIAATTALLGGVKQNLEILVDKSGTRPVEIRVRPEGDLATTVALKATLDKKVYNLSRVASVDAGTDVLWNIPRGTEELIAILKRDLKLEAVAVDGSAAPQKVIFSLRGSTAALNDLQKRCNGNKALAATAFERAFLPTIVATVDASKLTPAMTDALRASVIQANTAFNVSNVTQKQIEALINKYLKEINELTKLKTNIDKLQNQEVVNLQKRRANAEATITTSQQQIDALRPQISVNEQKLVQANAEYETAYRILEPHMARMDQLIDAVLAAQADESAASKRLAEIDNGISSLTAEVSRLNSELNSVRNEIGRARSEASQLDQEAQRARREMDSFDERSEIRRRTQQDSEISNLERRLRDLDSQERDAHNRLQQAENRLRQAESRFSQINSEMQQAQRTLDRAKTNREHALEAVRRCKDVPGQDCSTEEAKLEFAKNEVDSARSQVDALQGDYNRAQSELSNVRSHVSDAERDVREAQNDKQRVNSRIASRLDEIERQVMDYKNGLIARYRDARARSDQADARVSSLEAQARDIANVDLPRAQSDLNAWQNARPGAVSDLRSAQQDVANARANRDAFKRQVGWDQKEAAVDAAQAKVNGIKATLAQIDSDIKKREKLIRDMQAELADVQKKMDVALETIRLKQARSVEVQKALEPYDLERATLDARKAQVDREFSEARNVFAANLPQ